MQRQTLALSDVMQVPAGSYFLLAEAEYPVNVRIFRANRAAEDRNGVERGYTLEGEPFERIEIRTTVAQSVGVLSALWKESYPGAAAIVQDRASGFLQGAGHQVAPAGVATLLVPAMTYAKATVIKNIGANVIHIGGQGNVGVNIGYVLAVGESLRLTTRAAIYGYSAGGTTISGVTELHTT
jgi:hypothetical protein